MIAIIPPTAGGKQQHVDLLREFLSEIIVPQLQEIEREGIVLSIGNRPEI